MPRFPRRLALGLGFLLLTGGALQAQLDLPRGKKHPPRKGVEVPKRPRGDLAPRGGASPPTKGGEGKSGASGLDLPGARRVPGAPEAVPLLPSSYEASLGGAARFIFDELAKERTVGGGVARDAVESLAALGEPGLVEARRALRFDHAPTLVVCARLLLTHGRPQDHRAVAEQLQGKIPSAAAMPLLDALVENDPVLADPALLTSLLDHRSGAVRAAAYHHLEGQIALDHLPYLIRLLQSRRSDTRLRCVELAGLLDAPAVRNLLVDRLEDRSSAVAMRCAELLAGEEGTEVVETLRGRALDASPLDRGGAYALLALVLREERSGSALFATTDVPALLAGLRASDPLVIGAAAVALAGIGFRSPRSEETEWLDLEVPHQLVRLSSGVEFYRDFASLQGVTSRRLALISGRHFGADGIAWRRWWAEAAQGFRARRAIIDVDEGAETTLEIRLRDGPLPEDAIDLRGPDAAVSPPGAASVPGRSFFLNARECGELVALLRREGVFGAERLPSRTPATERGSLRSLEVSVQGQGKRFDFSEGAEVPWFERLANAVRATAERNRWQLFLPPGRGSDARSRWAAESAWWELEHTDEERGRHFVAQLFAHLRGVPVADRDAGVEELVRLYAKPGIPRSIDLPPLLDLLGAESYPGRRANSLVDLALAAARRADARGDGGASEAVDPDLGKRIVEVVLSGMEERAGPVIVRILASADAALARELAGEEDPRLRTFAAAALARDPSPEARERVWALLDDPEPAVEAAAVLALGRAGVEEARNAILLRARTAIPEVRVAALLAAGELGGEGVLEVLRLALFESDARVQVAGAEGLATLGDPASADLLVRLLTKGRGTPFFDPARRGLLRIGEASWDELLRVSVSSAEATRRDASLLLAEQGVAAAASNLITLLTRNPRDGRVAHELAVLTCIDFRATRDPAQAWWNWWDTVVHDDSRAWLRAASEREGVPAPPTDALGPGGTREGALFLVRLLGSAEDCVAERARRELGRMLGGDVGEPPPLGPLRDQWIDGLRALARERFPGAG